MIRVTRPHHARCRDVANIKVMSDEGKSHSANSSDISESVSYLLCFEWTYLSVFSWTTRSRCLRGRGSWFAKCTRAVGLACGECHLYDLVKKDRMTIDFGSCCFSPVSRTSNWWLGKNREINTHKCTESRQAVHDDWLMVTNGVTHWVVFSHPRSMRHGSVTRIDSPCQVLWNCYPAPHTCIQFAIWYLVYFIFSHVTQFYE